MKRTRGLISAGLLLAACGSDDPAAVDAGPLVDAAPTTFEPAPSGELRIIETENGGIIYAAFHDGPELPTPAITTSVGECAVIVRPAPALCDPACVASVCVAPDQCAPYRAEVSAGAITVTGLTAPTILTPGDFGYVAAPTPGAALFADDATIEVVAAGDAEPAFAATLHGVAPLDAPFQNLTLVDGQDATVTWTAGPAGSGATIALDLVVGWHGAPYEARLHCETADDGELVIPGAAIAALPRASSGLEAHPSTLARFTRAVVAGAAGPIELTASSQRSVYFTHP